MKLTKALLLLDRLVGMYFIYKIKKTFCMKTKQTYTLLPPLKSELNIVIFIHYKLQIAVAILDLYYFIVEKLSLFSGM